MTAPPPDPDEPEGSRDPRKLDFDAEFERIVAGWTPSDPSSSADSSDPPAGSGTPVEPVERPDLAIEPPDSPVEPVETNEPPSDNLRNLFRQAWPDEDEANPPSAEPVESEHFVPPPAPPIPRPEPRRFIAWAGLFGAPMLGLLLLVLGSLPSYVSFLLFCWFVGGFGYLVATMNNGGEDGWDDGAQV